MAMMKCPNCGEQISDKAKKCPHCETILNEDKVITKICSECGKEIPTDSTECPFCGCPLEMDDRSENEDNIVNKSGNKKSLKNNVRKIIPIAVIAVIIVVIIAAVYNVKVVKPKNTYNEAISLLENGKYDEANELFKGIQNYKDVKTIQEQLKYESYAYSAINNLKKYLKNPDSYQPYEITFYASLGDNSEEPEDELPSDEEKEKYPACIMRYGAQNGFGGNTTGYAISFYDSDLGEYNLLGACNSLDEDDYDTDDEDDLVDLVTCRLIKLYQDGNDVIGDIDLNRLKTVLRNDAYSTIKIIE